MTKFIPKKKQGKAIWTRAFPKQSKALHPERTNAGGVKARSKSEAVRMEVHRGIADMFKKLHPWCQACMVLGYWTQKSTQHVHHRRGREGYLLFDVRHFLPVCHGCHAWIGDHPAEAIELGLSEKRV